jgi:2-polyprenyl-3-methyl-5-hydroxy-6-metoxy-1,4-benzoquinol methylase
VREYLGQRGSVDYQVARTNSRWPDHVARSFVTAGLIAWLKPDSVVDPACGDASIVRLANRHWPIDRIVLGDIGSANVAEAKRVLPAAECIVGDAMEILDSVDVDLVVLTEFIEHVEDPDALLRLARAKGKRLVASSPEMRPGQRDNNPEHLWQFDTDGYRVMLEGAGWVVSQRTFLSFPSEYDFGVWVCK